MIMTNSLSALYSILNEQVKETINNQVAYDVSDKLNDFIFKRVYNAYEPSSYIRQFELLNSVSIKIKDTKELKTKYTYNAQVYCDYNKMNHTSWSGGKVYVATFVNDGSTRGRPKADFIKYTMDDLQETKSYLKEFKQTMRGIGYNVL